jgi:hypothetical protein
MQSPFSLQAPPEDRLAAEVLPVEVMAVPMMSAATTKTQLALAKPVRATTGVVMPNTTQALAIKSASTPAR